MQNHDQNKEESSGGKGRAFDSYPYMLINLYADLVHITVLPGNLPIEHMSYACRHQAQTNYLTTALVLGPFMGVFYKPGKETVLHSYIPHEGPFVTGGIRLAMDIPDSEEMRIRQALLREYLSGNGLHGDCNGVHSLKFGEEATAEQRQALRGRGHDGMPKGLKLCNVCQMHDGCCLDPDPAYEGLIMPVFCKCRNRNHCIGCGKRLHEYTLASNYYDPEQDRVVHVPASVALSHRC